ncbi:His Kinase A (phospho-acceptor) domain-containing protein [Maribacter sedimenticola]|uniref:histidine kinase n=1 Tax=Maribacter sedimenticola TaxID=228956 RepID=A0ABY1SFI6_9FLAO|nr:ATP-binding protein [Maribacter sedimenticola]SNR42003.1 His Kinase A (phospho-acceptor) domain-containing protein [Maribacter sedimenticola]
MKRILYIIGFLLPLTVFSQQEKVLTISDTTVADKWMILGEDWRYQKGDNIVWANPEFDDSTWNEFSSTNLNLLDGKNVIADRGEIVWLRKRIMADQSFNDALVLNIFQEGASEIYLDGKLIHQLGNVSSNKDEVIYHNPFSQVLHLPLEIGKEQILAVRFVNAQYKYPIYNHNGLIRIFISSLRNANSTDVVKNKRVAYFQQFVNSYYISLGLAILMFIIFLSFFIFFPKEKINGYFAASLLFLILFTLGVLSFHQNTTGTYFWLTFYYDTCILISSLILLFCFYKILEKPIDLVYKAISFLCFLTIGCYFLFNPDALGPIWSIFYYVGIIRLSLKSWKKNKIASFLFLSSSCINLVFWTLMICWYMGLVDQRIDKFIPFSFMLVPVVLAIYLGYAFGKRSQDLRLNLNRVQELSKEKESILSQQKNTLEQLVKERTSELNQSLDELKTTQSQLIQSEKMASLGELTAGIAHEIQNPLNFVNNFSEVSNELVDEMNEELDKGDLEEVKAISLDIKHNLEKINHHGKRADNIVKGMLQHSRSSSGTKEPTDINALADEYLRLAYHGLRAKDKSFNAELITNFDESIGKVNIVPQDMGRVILNLITNAFYAVNEKKQRDVSFKPIVTVSTKKSDEHITISVSDNGNGIPEKVKEKIFQPFFTTKPTGQGTGLGLSMSYDIITKGHSGELLVTTQQGEGTTFKIIFPLI